MKKKHKYENENKIKNEFSFQFSICFSFSFWFLFLLSKKFGTFVNPRGLEVPEMVNCLLICPEVPFLGKFGPKSQNYQFKMKFGTYTNANMQNSIAVFTFFVFDRNPPFWANFIQKSKLSVKRRNLVASLIRKSRIQRC